MKSGFVFSSLELKEREAMDASLYYRVDVADLRKAKAESALKAKAHELLARVAERIPSLEAAAAQGEAQILIVVWIYT